MTTETGPNPNPQETMFLTACLLQRGATSPKTPGGTKMVMGSTTITVDLIRKHCRNERITVRQFARGIKQEIMDIMLTLGESAP
jgi:hypothetical protein